MIAEQKALVTIYKDFISPYLHYGYNFYDKVFNASFH